VASATWTCVATVGASCTASGSGSIADLVDLPAVGSGPSIDPGVRPRYSSVTYTLRASVDVATTSSQLVNTASVSLPAGFVDDAPGDNTDSDTDTIVPPLSVTQDFNGDGKSDILFLRPQTGAVREWLLDGATVTSDVAVGTAARTTDQIVGLGDYDGNGQSDILWWNPVGKKAFAWLNGSATSVMLPNAPEVGALVFGSGDYNGDGVSDILWFNPTSRRVYVWLLKRPPAPGTVLLLNGSTLWLAGVAPYASSQLVGSGDYDGDGKSDILWKNSLTGDTQIWFMTGSIVASRQVTSAQIGNRVYPVVGSGDHDGDGDSDILWASPSQRTLWLMNGPTVVQQGTPASSLPQPGVVVGSGDYDGNGKSDILWRDPTTEDLLLWLMDGFTLSAQSPVVGPGPSVGWVVVTPR
jgi:hypothetical protein